MSEKTMSLADAARDLAERVDAARTRNESTVLVKDGAPIAKIVPFRRGITGRELLAIWRTLTHLTPEDAERFESGVQRSQEDAHSAATRMGIVRDSSILTERNRFDVRGFSAEHAADDFVLPQAGEIEVALASQIP